MSIIGKIDSVWRYPVKSMRGEQLDQGFLSYSGVYGDRIYAFRSSDARDGFPFHTGRQQEEMILFTPRFRDADAASQPVNLAEAERETPSATPLFAGLEALAVDVTTPSGDTFAIDDPALIDRLKGKGDGTVFSLIRSERALTDCRPVTIFSLQTVDGLAGDIGEAVDKRQFRANLYADFTGFAPFAEGDLLGQRLRIGERAEVMVLAKDPRCKMITLDPDTAEQKPGVLRQVYTRHGGNAGLFAAVLAEGTVRAGDPITVIG